MKIEDDNEWQLRWVRIPNGTHLSESKGGHGQKRDLLREDGTNKLLGPTESVPADERAAADRSWIGPDDNDEWEDESKETEFVAQVVGVVISQLIIEIVRSVDWERLWADRLAPAVGKPWKGVSSRILARKRRPRMVVNAVERADTRATTTMTTQEYVERSMRAMAARLLAEKEQLILEGATIDDDELKLEFDRALKSLNESGSISLSGRGLSAVRDQIRLSPIGNGESPLELPGLPTLDQTD